MIKTSATNKKIRELIQSVKSGSVVPRPEFQRNLVWTSKDKDSFIDTILKGYPFPEIYMCDGDVDTETGVGTQLLVDGLQRVSTINEYFSGESTISYNLTLPYSKLSEDEKKIFLEYIVVVRDLGSLSKAQIVDVFKRLNSTQYTLRDMEIHNAVYSGEMKKFCDDFSSREFFENNKIFSPTDIKRMSDVAYCLNIVSTMMEGYFNRDSAAEDVLKKYNEIFPDKEEYNFRIDRVISFIEECGFHPKSRVWKKADFFTLFVELDKIFDIKPNISPSFVVDKLEEFYLEVDSISRAERQKDIVTVYYKSALQASNDRANRLRRAFIVFGLLTGDDNDAILEELAHARLL